MNTETKQQVYKKNTFRNDMVNDNNDNTNNDSNNNDINNNGFNLEKNLIPTGFLLFIFSMVIYFIDTTS